LGIWWLALGFGLGLTRVRGREMKEREQQIIRLQAARLDLMRDALRKQEEETEFDNMRRVTKVCCTPSITTEFPQQTRARVCCRCERSATLHSKRKLRASAACASSSSGSLGAQGAG